MRHVRIVSDFALRENGGDGGTGALHHDGASKSIFSRTSNTLRSRLRQLTQEPDRRKGMIYALAYVIACGFLLWLGTQIPTLFRPPSITVGEARVAAKDIIAGGARATESGLAVEAAPSVGSREGKNETGNGPNLAYGIMVYQRKGHTTEKTLGQFTRMFDALYDDHNT